MSLTKKNILITGGAGFIGSHTAVALLEAGFTPIVVDNFVNAHDFILENLETITNTKLKVYRIDCCDAEMEQVFTNQQIHGVIHFAAYKAVGESSELPIKYYQNNLNSMMNVLLLMKKHKVDNFVFSSSATIYGNPDVLPITESELAKVSLSPYGNTKQICEEIIQDVAKNEYPFHATILRYFNPIGAHDSGLIGELPMGRPNNLVPYITQALSGKVEKLRVFGNDYDTPDGTCIRDYIHVVDLANAHVKALEQLLAGRETNVEVYNVGTGKGNSVLELIRTYEAVTGMELPFEFAPRREGDVMSLYADVSKAKKELNWEANLSLAEALKHSWDWQLYVNEKMKN